MSCSAAPTTGGRRRSKKMKGGMGYGFGGTIGTAGPVWDSSWGGEITKAGAPVYDTADPQRGSSRRRKARKGGERVEATSATSDEIARVGLDGLRAVGAVEVLERTEAESRGYTILGPAKATAGRRHRKSKKQSKKSRKGRRKTMRGGASWQSVAPVGYGYTGTGSRGMADATQYSAKTAPAGAPPQNADGAYRA